MTDDDRQRAAETPAESGAGEPAPAADPAPAPAAADEPVIDLANPGALPPGEPPAPGKAKKQKRGGNWLDDLKAIIWLLLAVLVFHSCVAKPFYIPSESMMPGLLKGDRLVVSKYPYGWSWVSPSFHIFPHWEGRIWGAMPRRGDIVIVTPPNSSSDYIKRVIGLPGDTIQVVDGQVVLNGQPLRRERRPDAMIPIDENITCKTDYGAPAARQFVWRVTRNGRDYCRMRVFREYIPDGNELRAYDTIDAVDHARGPDEAPSVDDWPHELQNGRPYYTVPAGHVFLMGDNRDDSADSRVPLEGMGLGGGVPWENIGGRAEFITFSLDGSSSYWNPVSWFTALRGGRAGTSLHPESVPAAQGGASR